MQMHEVKSDWPHGALLKKKKKKKDRHPTKLLEEAGKRMRSGFF